MDFLTLPGVSECHFRKGDVLIYAGQEVDCVYYLKKGVIYREIITASGNESILSTKAGDRLVESLVGVLIFYRPGPSTSNFIAHTNCICYRIPKKSMYGLFIGASKAIGGCGASFYGRIYKIVRAFSGETRRKRCWAAV